MTPCETAVPPKYQELINLAVAAKLKCPYCIHFHCEAAKLYSTTDQEVAELSVLAGGTPRYSSVIHPRNYDLETFEREVEQTGSHLQLQLATDD